MPTLCQLCGAHFPESERPSVCPLCEDVRGLGFTPRGGARITTLEGFQTTHTLTLREEEPGLLGIGVEPSFGAGNRALIVQTNEGNVMWDCIPLIDDSGVTAVEALGGLAAIAISHPHFYGAMVEWSRSFGGVPIYVHARDREWVTHPDAAIVYWEGATQALPGNLTLIHCGGHFDGAAVLHWPDGAEGRGALLTGDAISVTADRHVTFMYAYPNLIPLGAGAVQHIADSIAAFSFDQIRDGWFGRRVPRDAKTAVDRSVARYLAAIQ